MPHLITLSIIFIIWTLSRFSYLNDLPFWIDEANTFNVVSKSIFEYWNYVIVDRGTMPLSYLIYQFENWIEPNHLLFRLPSIIASLFICILVYSLAKQFYDKKTAVIALFLNVIHPNLLYHSREARAYSFFALLFLLWFFLLNRQDQRTSHKNKKFYYYALLINSFLLVFIHPYGLLIYVFLLIFALYINSLKWQDLKLYSIPLILGVLMIGYLVSHPSVDAARHDMGVFLKHALLTISGINPELLMPLLPEKINLAASVLMLILLLSVSYPAKRFILILTAAFFVIFPLLHSFLNIVFAQRYLVVFIPLLLIQISYCLSQWHSYLRTVAFAALTVICTFNAIDVLLIEKSFFRPFHKHELSQFSSWPDAPVIAGVAHEALLKMYDVPNKIFTVYPESFNSDQVNWIENLGGKSFSLYNDCDNLKKNLKLYPYFFDAYFPLTYFAPSECPNIYKGTKKIDQIDKTSEVARFVSYKPIILYKNIIHRKNS